MVEQEHSSARSGEPAPGTRQPAGRGVPPLGVGVIGAGKIIGHHAHAYLAVPRLARLVGVADLDRDRAERARREYGFEAAFSRPEELLAREDVQVVSICTRPDTHAELIVQALEAGKDVLCEKPMATTLADADRIVAAAERHPERKLSFVYQWRTDPAMRRLRRLVERKGLGRLLMADVDIQTMGSPGYYQGAVARESWAMDGGGRLIVVGIHQIDALLSFLGEPAEVSARMDTFLMPTEGEDSLVGWVRFADGALATLRCTACSHESYFQIEVLAERALVRLRGTRRGRLPPAPFRCSWRVASRNRRRRARLQALGWRESLAAAFPPWWLVHLQRFAYRGLRRRWRPPAHWFHGPSVREFLEAVVHDRPVSVPAPEARRSLELVAALYESALTGRALKLPLGEESTVYRGVDPARLPARRGEAA